MIFDKNKDGVSELELSDKLPLAEDIKALITPENTKTPVPEWQKNKLDKRYKNYKDGKLVLNDWVSVHKDLREKYKRNEISREK